MPMGDARRKAAREPRGARGVFVARPETRKQPERSKFAFLFGKFRQNVTVVWSLVQILIFISCPVCVLFDFECS